MIRTCLHLVALFLFVSGFHSCQSGPTASYPLIIENVRLVDIQQETVSDPVMIAIAGDTIQEVTPMSNRRSFQSEKVIDAEGRFIMPGLWDMHVHFRGGDSLIEENKDFLKMFLDHGITTVRDAGGDITPAVISWKNAIASHSLPGPDIFTSGPKLDGASPAWEGSLSVTSRAGISSALDSLQHLEADFIKIYDGSLEESLYYDIIKACEDRQLMVTGHMPMDADLMKAHELGLDGIEHLYYLLAESSSMGDSLRALKRGYGNLPAFIESYDQKKALKTFQTLGSSSFFVTPTLHITQVLDKLYREDHTNDSLLQQMGPGIVKTYSRRERSAKGRSLKAQDFTEKRTAVFMSMVAPMQAAGITLLAGSDCGAFNSYIYPGASLQDELILMVKSGLSPAEALATSVINGPAFFSLEDYYGAIAPGKVAHLLLLENDPLKHIEAIKGVTTVIKGEYIHRP